ncbi:DNA-directed RNA polymerase II subunit RPB1 [Eumeta japonica]|uniref:DNA-directed RNA polymerase II subunit RPB1 n=1 Tax=Eumeta variegata TaxID=151549 RepID=A0A4C1XL86_EUMVA|nr:DNA-directed RNA polymerase II subunit RPB1 [Eumeta japonica]
MSTLRTWCGIKKCASKKRRRDEEGFLKSDLNHELSILIGFGRKAINVHRHQCGPTVGTDGLIDPLSLVSSCASRFSIPYPKVAQCISDCIRIRFIASYKTFHGHDQFKPGYWLVAAKVGGRELKFRSKLETESKAGSGLKSKTETESASWLTVSWVDMQDERIPSISTRAESRTKASHLLSLNQLERCFCSTIFPSFRITSSSTSTPVLPPPPIALLRPLFASSAPTVLPPPPPVTLPQPPVQQPTTSVPQPFTPVPQPTTPVPQPITPVQEPTTPVPQPTTPVPQPTTPVQQPTTPVPQPTTPVQQTTTPVPQPTTPVQQPTTPVPQPTTPVQQTTTPVPQPTTPVQQPTTPVPQPTTPVQQTTTPVQPSTIPSSHGILQTCIEDNQYKINISLTGYRKSDIIVNVNNDVLTIQAMHSHAGNNQHYRDVRTLPPNVDINFSWTYDGQMLFIVFPIKVLPETEVLVVEQITETNTQQTTEQITEPVTQQVVDPITEISDSWVFEFDREKMNTRKNKQNVKH